MTSYIKRLSLNNRLAILFSLIAIFSACNYLIINYYNSSSKSYAVILDLAGRTSVTSQKIGLYTKMAISGDEEARDLLKEQVQLFEKSVSILKNGGIVPSIYGNKIIPSSTPEALTYIAHMEEFWKEYKSNIQVIMDHPVTANVAVDSLNSIQSAPALNPAVKKAANYIIYNSGELLSRSDDLMEHVVTESNTKQKDMNGLILSLLAINMLFVIAGYLYVKRILIKPINLIATRAVKINEGDLTASIELTSNTEIGTVSHAINTLIESMKNAREFIKNIGQGNLDIEYKGLADDQKNNNESISGALLEMREQMRKVSNEEKERNWATEGLARFVEILRNNNDNLSLLSDNIISNLVNYVNANQGGIFIINDDEANDNYLELIACYAFETKKYVEKRINIGEGLVGQAYRENRIIYLTDIPNEYVQITSGLGGANPKTILIVPLKVNDVSHGVIELASFFPLLPYQVDFVKKLGESIASTISTVKINERTKRLLEESQTLTQAMQAQEEAMRNSLEELMATQEEMQRKEIEITGQLSAINNTLATVQFSMDGLVLNANSIFLKLMGYTAEEIKGKHHKQFCEKSFAYSPEHEAFWQDLAEGRAQTADYKRITKEGEEVWITATYTPVLGADGVPYKIIKLAIDITDQKIKNIDFQGQLEAISKSNAVIEFDINGRVLSANDQFLQLVGYELSELLGRHHRILIPEDVKRQEDYAEFWDQLKDGFFETGEFKHLTKAGTEVWIRGSYNPILDINGKPYKVVQFAQDITREKMLEGETVNKLEEIQAIEEELRQNMEELTSTQEELGRKLRESEEKEIKLKSALNNIYEGIITVNKEGEIESVNYAVLKLFEFLPDEIANRPLSTILPEINLTTLYFEEGLGSTSHDSVKKGFDTRGRKKDGSIVMVEVGISYSSFDDKKIFTLILKDISDKKRYEEKYKNLFLADNDKGIVFILDKKGHIEWANDCFLNLSEYKRDDVFGKDLIEILQGPDADQRVVDRVKRALTKKEAFSEKVQSYKRSGQGYWCQLSISPLIGKNGEVERFIALEEILEYAS